MNDERRRLIEASFEAAQQGFSRHSADITSSRNWCLTGVLVYYGAILVSDIPVTLWMVLPPIAVAIVASLFTIYERGNAELLRQYCMYAEEALMLSGENTNGQLASPLPLQSWVKENGPKTLRETLKFYFKSAKQAKWVWLLLLLSTLALTATGQAVAQCRPRQRRPGRDSDRPPAGYYPGGNKGRSPY